MKLKMYEVFRDRTGTLAEKIIYGFLLVIVVCLYIWMVTDERRGVCFLRRKK